MTKKFDWIIAVAQALKGRGLTCNMASLNVLTSFSMLVDQRAFGVAYQPFSYSVHGWLNFINDVITGAEPAPPGYHVTVSSNSSIPAWDATWNVACSGYLPGPDHLSYLAEAESYLDELDLKGGDEPICWLATRSLMEGDRDIEAFCLQKLPEWYQLEPNTGKVKAIVTRVTTLGCALGRHLDSPFLKELEERLLAEKTHSETKLSLAFGL